MKRFGGRAVTASRSLFEATSWPETADRARAVEWLNRAADADDVHAIFLTVDPKWDPLRTDPEFQAVLKRCRFAN